MNGVAQYKCEIDPKSWEALQAKAKRLGTTPEEMLDSRVNEFVGACVCEMRDERKNAVITLAVELAGAKLDELERAIAKLITPERGT